MALNPKLQSAQKSKSKNGRLASLHGIEYLSDCPHLGTLGKMG